MDTCNLLYIPVVVESRCKVWAAYHLSLTYIV